MGWPSGNHLDHALPRGNCTIMSFGEFGVSDAVFRTLFSPTGNPTPFHGGRHTQKSAPSIDRRPSGGAGCLLSRARLCQDHPSKQRHLESPSNCQLTLNPKPSACTTGSPASFIGPHHPLGVQLTPNPEPSLACRGTGGPRGGIQ